MATLLVRARGLMPEGTPLSDADWRRRHEAISLIAVVHVPVVLGFALLAGFGVQHAIVETLPVAVPAVVARDPRWSRRILELAATLSLVSSSAVLVHLSGGYIELHFHFFVIVALVTLYQQWEPFLLAIGFVGLHHGIAGAIEPASVFNHPAAIGSPWTWAAIHAGFIAMASAVGLANWRFNEQARHRAEEYFRHLYEGELAIVERLEAANRVTNDLVSAVSHEFRTPLTVITGFAHHLQRDQADPDRVADMAVRIRAQARRLEQLVDNLLEVGRTGDALEGTADVGSVVEAAAFQIRSARRRGAGPVEVSVEEDLSVPLAPDALRLVVANLLDNASKFSQEGTAIRVCARGVGDTVELVVSNSGPTIPVELAERIFEPFVQADSSATRQHDGVGLGLHIVQRVVGSVGGGVAVDSHDATTTFTVSLPLRAAIIDVATAAV